MRRIVVLAAMTASLAAFAGTAMAATINVNPWDYDPTPRTVVKGDTVKWTWKNAVSPHNVVVATPAKGNTKEKVIKSSGTQKKTGTWSYKFNAKGTFVVYCKPHRDFMNTTVTVN